MSSFVHLHVHSEYSLLDGAARVKDLARRAASLGMSALALTDHGVVYGAVPFYKACLEAGVKPIIGCEVYVAEQSMRDKGSREEHPTYHLVLLAKSDEGYRNLLRLVSSAHLEGYHYKPRIDFELLSRHAEGLICLSACLKGEIPQKLLAGKKDEALAAAIRYKELFGEDFFLEIQDHGLLEQRKLLSQIVEISRESGVPLVATNDVHYVEQEDAAVQDILMCIGMGKTVNDPNRFRYNTDQLYMKSPEEMARLFPHYAEAIANTLVIAERCSVKLELGRSILPAYAPLPDGLDAPAYLKRLCADGLVRRYGGDKRWQDEAFRGSAEQRLAFELDTIVRMGYADYFLITWDFIHYAHKIGIMTGPGRGSAAGSLVSYVLGITDVDPIRYGLLFERFLNPARVSMPDIDVDFNDERRDEVIDYVVRKYGRDRVAQIITFGTMAARAAVRDVGRALNLPYGDVDRVAKLIPGTLGMTLEEALRTVPELKEWAERDVKIGVLVKMALKVEGLPRHASTHAAGVVISRDPLTNVVALQEGTGSTALTQFSMENLEAVGLLKMDFLGLRTLSIIERTLAWIREKRGVELDLRRVPDDDSLTYEMLGRGDTTGMFQLESAGMRRVLRELKPSRFEDIISVLALFRPGPMEFIPKYIAGKHGRAEVEYPHPSLEPILGDTYGIIVYQEQIMQIASLMAGFTLGEADLLRRAVSKKKREVLDEQRASFVAGSVRQGYSEQDANAVYDMIVRFADYGFPRAHATAYAVLAFQTAYLKAHYPVEFMAAMLTANMGNHRKVAEYVDECRRMGVQVLPPDVNESGVLFAPVAVAQAVTAHGQGGEPGASGSADPACIAGDVGNVGDAGNVGNVGNVGNLGIAGIFDISGAMANARITETSGTSSTSGTSGTSDNTGTSDNAGTSGIPGTYGTSSTSDTSAIPSNPHAVTSCAPATSKAGRTPNAIRFGLAGVKNVGTQAIEAIMSARSAGGQFTDLIDLCRRVDLRVCNKRVLESLIAAGAADSLPGHRAQLLAVLDEAVEAAAKWKKEREDLQIQLFGLSEHTNWTIEMPEIRPMSRMEQLEQERELLGLYVTGHPLDAYADWYDRWDMPPIHRLHELEEGAEVLVFGMVLSVKQIVTRKGQQMAFLEVEDRIDKVEVVLFPEVWKNANTLVGKGVIVTIAATLQHGEEEVKLLASHVYSMDDPALPARLRAGGVRPAPRARSAGRGASRPYRPTGQEQSAPGAAGGSASSSLEPTQRPPRPQTQQHRPQTPHTEPHLQPPYSQNQQSQSLQSQQRARPTSNETASPARSSHNRNMRPDDQTLFVKIKPDKETQTVLHRLQALFKKHPGRVNVALFYERGSRLLELNADYRVSAEPVLLKLIERLLGDGTTRLK